MHRVLIPQGQLQRQLAILGFEKSEVYSGPDSSLRIRMGQMNATRQTALTGGKPIHVLSASTDSDLNGTRAQLLRHYGFHVVAMESKEAASEFIERGISICSSLAALSAVVPAGN